MHLVLCLLGAKLDLRESEGNWWLKAFPLQAVPQSSSCTCDSMLGRPALANEYLANDTVSAGGADLYSSQIAAQVRAVAIR